MKRSVVALSVLVLVAACSTQTAQESESSRASGDASNAAATPSGHVGDTLNLTRADDSKVAVTLTQIVNPATVADGKGDANKTYVATKLTIVDTGTTAIEGNVNVNVSVIGSDNQSYAPHLGDVTECTNFNEGTFHLAAGESATGCVVFELPRGVTPAKVKYEPSAGFAADFGEWLVPPTSLRSDGRW